MSISILISGHPSAVLFGVRLIRVAFSQLGNLTDRSPLVWTLIRVLLGRRTDHLTEMQTTRSTSVHQDILETVLWKPGS